MLVLHSVFRHLFLVVFSCFQFYCLAQPSVTFNQIPAPFQLYARNGLNNCQVPISGKINTFGYTSISLVVYRDNINYAYQKQNLTYLNNKASFSFSPIMQAGLNEYTFKIYALSGEDSVLVTSRNSIVCGDAYLVSGQSNARLSDDLETYQNKFCRTFGATTSNGNATNSTLGDTLWSLAKANGFTNVGVWPINLMRQLVEKNQVPVCIINGGVSQTKIFKHIKDISDPNYYTQTYYGRLHYRALKSGLSNSIKALFWYHGESNSDEPFSFYQPYFNQLYQDWNDDFPSLQKIYLFQINIGCISTSNSGNFREGQRKLPLQYSKIKTIATIGTPNYDGCHYDTAGYHFLAKQVHKIVATDFYGNSFEPDQYSPDIVRAYYTSSNFREIILEFSNASQLTWQNDTLGKSLKNYFYLDGDSTIVSSGYCYQNKVRLLLKTPRWASKITYLPNQYASGIFAGPYLKNKNKNGAFSFYEFEIEEPPVTGFDNTCPAAFGPIKHIYGTNKKNTSGFSITQNTFWSKDTIYVLHDYVRVAFGATLTIAPGTVIMGAMMPTDTAVLIVQKGGKLYANGSQKSPIVFTSCRTAGTRSRGDWGGIVVCGNAPNNLGNNIELEGDYKAIHGGTIKTDNSGSLQYVRIEYAGIKINNQETTNSLTLASVGNGTNIKYVQSSFSNNDSFEWLGGTVNAKYLVSWKPLDDDFDTNFGYIGNNQFGLGFRDFTAADISGSAGFESDNNATNTSAFPRTAPIFSNFECWGPKLTAEMRYNAFFKAGALLQSGTEIKLYNTLLLGWPGDSAKKIATILLNDVITVTKAKNDSLRFRNCYIGSYLPNFHLYSGQNAVTWSPFASMKAWYFKGSNFDSTANNVMYKEKKAPFREDPLFTISSSNSKFNRASSFSTATVPKLLLQPNGFFQSVTYRGAFGGSNWTQDWAEFNPQLVTYATNQYAYRDGYFSDVSNRYSLSTLAATSAAVIYPNPASTQITIELYSHSNENVKIAIINNDGKELAGSEVLLKKGKNELCIPVAQLSAGSYMLQIMRAGNLESSLLIIK